MEHDGPGYCSLESDCCWQLTHLLTAYTFVIFKVKVCIYKT